MHFILFAFRIIHTNKAKAKLKKLNIQDKLVFDNLRINTWIYFQNKEELLVLRIILRALN